MQEVNKLDIKQELPDLNTEDDSTLSYSLGKLKSEIKHEDEEDIYIKTEPLITEEIHIKDECVDVELQPETLPVMTKTTDMEVLIEDSLDGEPLSADSSDIPTTIFSTPGNTSSASTTSKKSNKNKVVTGYILYLRKLWKQVAHKNPDFDFGEISKTLGNEWRSLPTTEKQAWEENASKLNEESKASLLANEECASPAQVDKVYECLWDGCDFQFEEILDCIAHCVKDKVEHAHVQSYFQANPDSELHCQWRNCIRNNKKNIQPFPNLSRLIRHVRDIHINQGNGRVIPAVERSKNFKFSSKPAAVALPTPSATPNPLPPDLFLRGCVFVVVELDRFLEESIPDWQQQIEKHGGEVEKQYCSRVTHVLCKTQRHEVVMQALRDFKRCVTLYWLSDVMKRKQVLPPWTALHLPTMYLDTTPASKHLISLTGFMNSERNRVKHMIKCIGATFTSYFSKHNTLLIAAKAEGRKFVHAKKWGTPVVNVPWLTDVMLGNFGALNHMEHVKYQQFANPPVFTFKASLVPSLMYGWKMPTNISQESYERVKRSPSPVLLPKKPKKIKMEHTNDENESPNDLIPGTEELSHFKADF